VALFASFIIRLFQFVFSAGTVFFSHNKSAGTIFQVVFSAKRTGPVCRGAGAAAAEGERKRPRRIKQLEFDGLRMRPNKQRVIWSYINYRQ